MNWKTWTPLVVAVVLGLGAAKLARDLVMKGKSAAPPQGNTTQIVIAKKALAPGVALALIDLATLPLPADRIPEGAFTNPNDLVGRVPLMTFAEGQPIFKTLLADNTSGSGLQALLPDGMRAITIEVNEFSGVGGLLVPGCHVDLVASIQSGQGNSLLAKTLVQNVKVIAIGQRLSEPKPEEAVIPKSVTLVVTPEQAEAIELASISGRPRLVLRPGNDNGVVETAGVTLIQLSGRPADAGQPMPPNPALALQGKPTTPGPAQVAPAAPVAVAPRTVTVIRGSTESVVTFPSAAQAAVAAVPPAATPVKAEPAVSHTDNGQYLPE